MGYLRVGHGYQLDGGTALTVFHFRTSRELSKAIHADADRVLFNRNYEFNSPLEERIVLKCAAQLIDSELVESTSESPAGRVLAGLLVPNSFLASVTFSWTNLLQILRPCSPFKFFYIYCFPRARKLLVVRGFGMGFTLPLSSGVGLWYNEGIYSLEKT